MSARERTRLAYRSIEASAREEVWIHLRPEADVLLEAERIDARVAAGERLTLAGATVAVKDNIDVAEMPTTAGCPAYSFEPKHTAPAVQRLIDAGALILGKTNMDQFATGLVGTRSPYGAVRDMRRPEYVSGGSSSGSALAVALGIADLSLGTDTAGSGRVPAAFQGIVGIKPTRGLVPVTGVVPACRSLDCVTVFARTVSEARSAMMLMEGPCPADPLARGWPADAPLAAPDRAVVGVPDERFLTGLSNEAQAAFHASASRLQEREVTVVPIDLGPFVEAGALLYGGAFVAERHAAVGAFVEANAEHVDPTVANIVIGAGQIKASELVRDQERLDELGLATRHVLSGVDAILLPTTTEQPTLAAVADDPLGANSRLGLYTNSVNLLDLCAVAVPGGEADGGQFGVTLIAPAFHDRVCADLASRLTSGEQPRMTDTPPSIELFVVGAHLTDQPLNHQLTGRGGRLLGRARTDDSYRLFRLDTEPAKPGLVYTPSGGARIAGETWALSPQALGWFLAEIARPMAIGRVQLEDGHASLGFLCEPAAAADAEDITRHGGWVAYLTS